MIESDREKQWQREFPEFSFKSWLMIKLDNSEAEAAQLKRERDELARKLEQAHAEIVKLNNQIAQAVINSIRGDA